MRYSLFIFYLFVDRISLFCSAMLLALFLIMVFFTLWLRRSSYRCILYLLLNIFIRIGRTFTQKTFFDRATTEISPGLALDIT